MNEARAGEDLQIADHMKKPTIVDRQADHRFREMARAFGYDPTGIWVDGYVDYEWKRSRYFIQSYVQDLGKTHVLEFGCNVGGTAIVFAHLGAAVTAVDVDPRTTALAQANALRYGVNDIAFAVLPGGSTPLPFDDATFDIVSCNSVLEYVDPPLLEGIAQELGRVLKEGGTIFIMGTSSRLAPREVHSCRWLINYLPLFIDRLVGHRVSLQRGVWPWRIRGYFPGFRDLTLEDRGDAYISARRATGLATAKVRTLRTLIPIVGQVGWSIGMITPSLFLALRKPPSNAGLLYRNRNFP